eukprot:c18448_g1_i3.p1 GENE.c18448_g1_i3~~c18448_g1_i3.p1  ORF type:complete len:105 (+),score=18.71 c18448_g1_i3:74-388(+)
MRAKAVTTEIMCNLASSGNISTSLKQFGLDNETKQLLVVFINTTNQDIETVLNILNGKRSENIDISSFTNIEKIKQVYRIQDEELKSSGIVNAISTRISTFDCQ